MLSSTIMAKSVITCTTWAVLLLLSFMFPSRALGGGRHMPAGPPASSFTQSTKSRVSVVHVNIGRGSDLAGTQFQDSSRSSSSVPSSSSSHRKMQAGEVDSIYGRDRLLVGSSPPTCQGKCGSCSPCNPIHVSIGSPHGALTQQEYYPEVWRCKCGNRLFMP